MLDAERAHPWLEARRARHDRVVSSALERLREREHGLNIAAGSDGGQYDTHPRRLRQLQARGSRSRRCSAPSQ